MVATARHQVKVLVHRCAVENSERAAGDAAEVFRHPLRLIGEDEQLKVSPEPFRHTVDCPCVPGIVADEEMLPHFRIMKVVPSAHVQAYRILPIPNPFQPFLGRWSEYRLGSKAFLNLTGY